MRCARANTKKAKRPKNSALTLHVFARNRDRKGADKIKIDLTGGSQGPPFLLFARSKSHHALARLEQPHH